MLLEQSIKLQFESNSLKVQLKVLFRGGSSQGSLHGTTYVNLTRFKLLSLAWLDSIKVGQYSNLL